MELKQQMKLSQQLVMTPQLQQAIKLLQMSRMELVDTVREEILENPILEEIPESQQDGGKESGHGDEEITAAPSQSSSDSDRDDSTGSDNAADQANEIDWDRYLENHAVQAPMPSVRRGNDSDEMPNLEQTLTRAESLDEHLYWQIKLSDFNEEERKFAMLVVGNLDEHGYLKMDSSSTEPIVPKLAEESGLDPEDAEEVLKIMQRFDPVGICSRDLKECLLVQVEHYGMDILVRKIIEEHLTNLERKNYQAIAKELEFSIEDVYDAAELITGLEPRPARNFITEDPQYITPDVYVHKVGEKYFVVANDDGMPKLKISNFYRTAMQGNEQAREYVQNKLRSAQWLIRSIDQRRKTIVKVAECLVEKQKDFFEKGVEFLKPMILRDVADAVGMHESTISRVTSNKYVSTPQGLFELKFFFNSGIRRNNDVDIASESVKQAIKKIVSTEDPKHPHSDQKIVELLAAQDVVIARRTVAKYREMLGILSSSKRKKYF